MVIEKIFKSFLTQWYLLFSINNDQDEKTIKIPRSYEWQTPKHLWIHQRIWIPEQLQFIVRKTARIKYGRKEVNRKLNKILLHELTIDASLETEIGLVDENEQHDLIGRVSSRIIFFAKIKNEGRCLRYTVYLRVPGNARRKTLKMSPIGINASLQCQTTALRHQNITFRWTTVVKRKSFTQLLPESFMTMLMNLRN